MPAGVILRAPRDDDAPALARLYLRARQAAMPGLPEPHDEADVARWLPSHLIARHTVRVAERDGRVIGYMGTGRDPAWARLRVLHLYLDPDWTGRGIGARLLALAKAESGGPLTLYAFQRNRRARAFYAREGFREVARGDGSDNDEGWPDVLLAWRPHASPATETRSAEACSAHPTCARHADGTSPREG